MAERLVISLNGESMLEYDRTRSLEAGQRMAIDKMDAEMSQGITLGGERIAEPDPLQRAHFVALHLIQAVRDSNENKAGFTTAYLAERIPELRQVRITEKEGAFDFSFVFGRDYAPEAPLQFTPLDAIKPNKH